MEIIGKTINNAWQIICKNDKYIHFLCKFKLNNLFGAWIPKVNLLHNFKNITSYGVGTYLNIKNQTFGHYFMQRLCGWVYEADECRQLCYCSKFEAGSVYDIPCSPKRIFSSTAVQDIFTMVS